MPLKQIMDDQKVTTYELAGVLESCVKALKDLPLSVIRNVEYEEQEAYSRIEATIKAVNNRLVILENAISASEEEYEKAINAHYNKTAKLVNDANKRLGELPKIEQVGLPYNFKDVLDIAERFGHLTPEQWARVVELARAFAGQ